MVDLVTQMYDAIEAGDMELLGSCFAPGAIAWHNDTCKWEDFRAAFPILKALHDSATEVKYLDRRISEVGNTRFVQHVLTASFPSGAALYLPIIMRVDVNDDGFVVSLEEYYDSRATDCLVDNVPALKNQG